jgi:type II secretory pathway pseudopilin PulG
MNARAANGQRGVSLIGLIFVLAILAMLGVLALKIVPTVSEYQTIKKAIGVAKAAGSSIPEIRSSFDKQADTGYVESIAGKDLDIVKTADGFEVSFAYEKKIPLFGPASLVLDYEGSTAPTSSTKAPKGAAAAQ